MADDSDRKPEHHTTRTRAVWNRLAFAFRGGSRLNGVADESTARGFHLLLAWVLVWILLLLTIGVPFFAARPTGAGIVSVVLGVATLGALYLVRAGRVRAASLLFLISVWSMAEASSAVGGGLRGVSTALVVLIIVNAGWLLGRASAIILTVATLLIALAESLAAYFGHPLPLYFPGNPIGLWMLFAGYLLFALNPILAILETLRRQVAALRRSEERFHTIVDSVNDAIFMHDIDTGRILDVNRRAGEMYGYPAEEMRRLSVEALSEGHPPHSQAEAVKHMARARAGTPETFEWLARHRDGRLFWVEVAMRCERVSCEDRLFVVVRDITERKQLTEAQKMESIGRLAGGIAHDFNNVLTVINGYSRLILAGMNSEDPLRRRLEEINRAGEHAAGVTKQLLAFSRKQLLQPRLVDCNRVVESMRPMLATLVEEDVKLSVKLYEGATTVYADPHQLEQVILNLAVNARDAMPQGGTLLIETAVVESDAGGARLHSAKAGTYVMLAMTDSGLGIDDETRQHIFEPFFTTKPIGKGTGLGLSTIHGIVEQSGGYVEVASEPGRGTTFRVYLPKVADAPDDSSELDGASLAAMAGTEIVLVVEDQAKVREYVAEALTTYGYGVIQAENGSEALLVCKEGTKGIHLVLTDVVMPDLSGRELADRLAEQRPDIKVLFMSGYTEDAILRRGALREGAEFIHKPFSPAQLAARVRRMLDPSSRTARVLVADDEAAVRDFLRMVLEGGGYEVIEAANGKQTIQQVRAGRVDLLITDLVMPEQEGIETIIALRKEAPGIRIIAISGAFGGKFLYLARLFGVEVVLTKPVNANLLLAKVAELLSRR